MQRNEPFKFTFNVFCHSSKLVSSSLAEGPEIPALLIRQLIPPNCSFNSSNNKVTCSSFDTSVLKVVIVGFSLLNLPIAS